MNYEEFKDQIKNEIKDYLPEKFEDAIIGVDQVVKNNDTVLDALTVRTEDSNVTPSIYLNPYYEDYENGRDMDSILQAIADVRVDHDLDHNMDTSMIMNFDQAKDHIVCHLLNAEENEQYLMNKPHKMVEDLAVTYHVQLSQGEDGTASVAIHNGILAAYGIDAEQLDKIAIENMEKVSPAKLQSMNDVMQEMMLPQIMGQYDCSKEEAKEIMADMLPPDDGMMFVLSNEDRLYGAAEILNPAVQEMIADQVGGDYYVLPSSVHETLIVPKTTEMNFEELENMVQQVNANEVSKEEKLSDHVYEYDAQAKELMRSDKAEERRAMRETKQEKAEGKEEKRSLKERLAEKKAEASEINKSHTKSAEKHKEAALA